MTKDNNKSRKLIKNHKNNQNLFTFNFLNRTSSREERQ